MHPLDIIGQHLNRQNLKLPIVPLTREICVFSGKPITEGVPTKKLIKKTFTDQSYLRFTSDYASVDAALCIEAVISGNKGLNSLRNYSFLATNEELRLLKREEIWDILMNPPKGEFVIGVTYSHKKHIAYKAMSNRRRNAFYVTTDEGNVIIYPSGHKEVIDIIQRWYTCLPEKISTKQQPTFFTKKDILNGTDNYNRIERYGFDKFLQEDKILARSRRGPALKLLVHCLNKQTTIETI